MMIPRDIDMTEAGRHMPLPPPKPKILELVEANKHDNGKVDVTTDEGRQRQVAARKPPPRDCATGSDVDCDRKSVLPAAIVSKRLPTTGQGPADRNQLQQHQLQQQQQQSQKQRLAQQSQPGIQGRRSEPQQQGAQGRGPQQKRQPPTTEGRGPQQKQQPKATEARGTQLKQQPPAANISRWHDTGG
jgi:hypothetical protein